MSRTGGVIPPQLLQCVGRFIELKGPSCFSDPLYRSFPKRSNTMPIQAFSFPIPETRFFHVGQLVYKFKIRRGSQISGEEEMLESEVVNEELENAVRVVLMSLENLHPFTTQHFNIFPYKSRWERVSELRFWKGENKLFAYPFLVTLYVETNQWIPPLTVSHANKWVPSDRESGLDSPHLLSSTSCGFPLANAHRRNEKPQADCLTSSHQHDKMDPHLCLQELPNLSEGAEETVCDDEEYADSEESSPDEQNSPDTKETEQPGAFSKLASFAVFPFSLLFRKS